MALKATGFLIECGQLPVTFRGTPAQFAAALVQRMRIVSPTGVNTFFVGSVEPTSNVGPWLSGQSWRVFDDETKRYVPLDITDSEKTWYHIGTTTPTTIDPPLWLRTERDPTADDSSYGDAIEWLTYNGSTWGAILRDGTSGPTAQRPTSPFDLQTYFDSEINTEIIWERGAWRTRSGSPGDVKAVAFPTLAQALQYSPGWELLGASNQSLRGRGLVQAARDQDGSNSVTVDSGVPARNAFQTGGETEGLAIDALSPVAYPPFLAVYHLVKM